jgi:hypothetical protein
MKAFYKTEDSFKAPQHLSCIQFNRHHHDPVLSAHAIKKHEYVLLKKTGLALKKKPPGGTRSTHTMKNTAAVWTALIWSTQHSARPHVLSLNLFNRNAQQIFHHPCSTRIKTAGSP